MDPEQIANFMMEQTNLIQGLVKQIVDLRADNQGQQNNTAQKAMNLLSSSITEFVYDPQNGNTFNNWYARYEDAFTIDGVQLDDAAKTRLLLRKLDSYSHSKYINFILPKKPSENNFDQTVTILKRMFGEPESLFSIRYNCFKLMKKQSDDYITFASLVNKECERFKFSDLKADQFKCLIFVCGLQASDKDIRTRLLMKLESDQNINLDTLTAECKRLIDLKSDSELITPKSTNSLVPKVNKISSKSKNPKSNQNNKSKPKQESTQNTTKMKLPKRPCWLCGDMHWVKDCLYSKHTCRDCSKIGHKEGFCGTDRPISKNKNQAYGNSIKAITNFKADLLRRRKYLMVEINDCPIKLQVDTASDVSVISLDIYNKLGQPSAIECFEIATSATGDRLSLKFEFDCKLGCHGTETSGVCYVTNIPNLNLIGNDWLDLLGLFDVPLNSVCNQIQHIPSNFNQQKFIEDFKQRFSSVFNPSIGTCTKTKASLRLKPDTQPIFRPIRPVPYAALPIVEAELDRLVDNGVLDDDSKKYLTINTHRGLFQYNRLPFGIKTASAIFQQIIDTMIAGLQRTCGFQDDVMVNGRTIEEHNRNLLALLDRIKEWGFHVRMEKCLFFMTEIEYLGFIIDEHGRRPNPARIEAIRNMPPPHDVATVRSFLGMLNYYSQFIKEMRSLRNPLDKLLCKDVTFEWTIDCQKAFERAKEILQSDLLLTHFDPAVEIKVAADASVDGIGAVILHCYPDGSEKAIEHASRALTPAEKNYGQIEKEGLSLIFAVKKFHKMIWGRKFLLQTDHKPLLAIFGSKKGIPVHSSSRLQRWALTLMPYDFEIEHVMTSKFGHADVLSRLLASRQTSDETIVIASIQLMEDEVNRILVDAIRILPVTAELIESETSKDPVLSNVIEYLRTSWPAVIHDEQMKILFNRRESLSEINGCLLFNERVIIPLSLQPKVLNQLQKAHPGIVRMKALARSYVYWPNIDSDITDYVQQCSRCSLAAKAPVKVELSSWPKASHVWSRIHIDFAGPFQGHNYLVVVDSFSKWPEVFIMSSTTSSSTISKLEELISRFGLMDILVSDNGPQFKSHEFEEFCIEQGISHIPTPPYHPQSNGQAEKFVDTFKTALTKAKGEESIPKVLQTFLHRYRITPNAQLPNNSSPAEIMFGRKVKSTLDLLKPKSKYDLVRNSKMEMDFNVKHGAKQRFFIPKQNVYVRDFREGKSLWSPAVVIERRGSVIYTVYCDGIVWRRHANQIRPRFNDEYGNSDPTLSLLFDVFDIPDQPNRVVMDPLMNVQNENSQPSIQLENENNVVNPLPVPVIHNRPQRNRRPPVRTDFSTIVGGRYKDN